MKKISLLLSVFLLSSFIVLPISVFAQGCDPLVTIEKSPFCLTYPGAAPGSPGDLYSTNPIDMVDGIPVYPAHTKLYWWIEITVTATVDMTDVVVYDRLGAEFMVEGIYDDGPLTKGAPEPALTYTFDYGKDTLTDVITPGQAVTADGASGTVDKDGITVGDFTIYWTGNSCKVHFMWSIGEMSAGATEVVYLVISTDLNPAGHQEFTSPGTAFLNSGATVKGLVEVAPDKWRQVSAETAPIRILVVET